MKRKKRVKNRKIKKETSLFRTPVQEGGGSEEPREKYACTL